MVVVGILIVLLLLRQVKVLLGPLSGASIMDTMRQGVEDMVRLWVVREVLVGEVIERRGVLGIIISQVNAVELRAIIPQNKVVNSSTLAINPRTISIMEEEVLVDHNTLRRDQEDCQEMDSIILQILTKVLGLKHKVVIHLLNLNTTTIILQEEEGTDLKSLRLEHLTHLQSLRVLRPPLLLPSTPLRDLLLLLLYNTLNLSPPPTGTLVRTARIPCRRHTLTRVIYLRLYSHLYRRLLPLCPHSQNSNRRMTFMALKVQEPLRCRTVGQVGINQGG